MIATLVAFAAFSASPAEQVQLPSTGADARCESVYNRYKQLLIEPEPKDGRSHQLRVTIVRNHCNGAGVIDVWLDNVTGEPTWTVRKQLVDRTGALQVGYATESECRDLDNALGQLATLNINLSLTSLRDRGQAPLFPGSDSYTFLFDRLTGEYGSSFGAEIRASNGPLVKWVQDELLGDESCWSNTSPK